MRTYILLFCVGLIFAVSTVFGQEAKVVVLDKEDAAMAKQKWDALKKAERGWDDAQTLIREKYLTKDPKSTGVFPGCNNVYVWSPSQDGWSCGFQFDKDFKFIVPKECPKSNYSPWIYSTPGTGIFSLDNGTTAITPLTGTGVITQ